MILPGALRPLPLLAALLAATTSVLAKSDAAEDPNAPVHAGTETVEVMGEGAVAGESPTGFVTVIRPGDQAGRVSTLADLLGESVGVRVRSYGGLHSFATVSIRGSTAEQVVVTVDGVPLNSPLFGSVNLADIPLAGVERIEVHRGFAPASAGASSIGGVVEIRTRRPGGDGGVAGSLAYGSYGSGEIIAMAGGGGPALRWTFAAQGFSTDGEYDYLDNNGTEFNARDDTLTTRINNEGWTAALRARGESTLGGGLLTIASEWMRRRAGVPGIDSFQSATAGLDVERGLVRAGWSREGLLSGRIALEGSADYEFTRQEFDDTGPDNLDGPAEAITRVAGAGLRLRLLWTPSPRHRVSFLAEPRRQWADSRDRILMERNPLQVPLESTRSSLSLVAEEEARFAQGRLLLSPSARLDLYDTRSEGGGPEEEQGPAEDPSAFSGRLGALWAFSPSWALRANAGLFNRVPTLLELYGNEGTIVGNPDLSAERGLNADLGISFHARPEGFLDAISFEVAGFRTEAEDLIQLVTQANRTLKARNIGAARITGVETSLAVRLFGRLAASANYTYQRAVDRSGTFGRGEDLPGRPREEAFTQEDLTLGPVTLFHRFSFVGENTITNLGEATGNLPESRRDLTRLPARYLHDAGARFRIASRLSASLEVLNIADRHVVDVARYPLPGRTIFLKLNGSL